MVGDRHRHTCPTCGSSYSSESSLAYHLRLDCAGERERLGGGVRGEETSLAGKGEDEQVNHTRNAGSHDTCHSQVQTKSPLKTTYANLLEDIVQESQLKRTNANLKEDIVPQEGATSLGLGFAYETFDTRRSVKMDKGIEVASGNSEAAWWGNVTSLVSRFQHVVSPVLEGGKEAGGGSILYGNKALAEVIKILHVLPGGFSLFISLSLSLSLCLSLARTR